MNTLNFKFIGGKPDDAYVVKIDLLGFFLVGVPRAKITQACNSDDVPSQGVYFLVNTRESKYDRRYLYVGQTKTGPHRLIDHKAKKEEWDMAYMFLGPKSIIPLQIVDELEAIEIAKYKDNPAFNFVNEKPNKAEASIDSNSIADIIEDIMTFLGYGASESLAIYEKGRAGKTNKSGNDAPATGIIYYADTKITLFGTKPNSCNFRDKAYDSSKVNSFRSLVVIVANNLYELKPEILVDLANRKAGISKKAKKPIISNSAYDLRTPLKIADEIYLETNISSQTALDLIKMLLEACGVKIEDFHFTVTESL